MRGRQSAASTAIRAVQEIPAAVESEQASAFNWSSSAVPPRQDTLDASAAATHCVDDEEGEGYDYDDFDDDALGESSDNERGGTASTASVEQLTGEPKVDLTDTAAHVAADALPLTRRELLAHPDKLANLPLLDAILCDTNVTRVIRELQAKVESNAAGMTAAEKKQYSWLLPRKYRVFCGINAAVVISAMRKGAINWLWLAHTLLKELNDIVYELASDGKVNLAARFVDILVEHGKTNPHTYASFFAGACHADDVDAALPHWPRWCKSPDFTDIAASAVIQCALAVSSRKGVDICMKLYQMRKRLSARTYNAVLLELGYDGLVDEALEFFDFMQGDVDIYDVVSFQHLLLAVEVSGQLEMVEDLYQIMAQLKVRPDEQLAATLMKLFTRAKMYDRVHEVYSRRLGRWDVRPTAYHYNAIMLAHARLGEWEACVNLYESMRRTNVPADHCTVVALLTCVSYHRKVPVAEVHALVAHFEAAGILRNIYIGGAMLQALRTILDTSGHDRYSLLEAEVALLRERGIKMNAIAYNILIEAAWETKNYLKARAAYMQMVHDGVQPSSHTVQLLIYISAEEGRTDLVQEYETLRKTLWELEVRDDEVGPIYDDFEDA